MLDNLLTMELKSGKLHTIPKSPHSHVQAKNLKTNVNSTTAAKLKDPERRADKIPQCRITKPYSKETMELLKQKNLRKRTPSP